MTTAQASPRPLAFGTADATRAGGLRWLSPALVGLTLPMIIALIGFPFLATEGRMLIEILLMVMLLLSIVAYVLSVLMPGELVGFIIDEAARTLILVREGPFATSTTAIAIADIGGLRPATRYDDDGYGVATTEIVTQAGEAIELPLTLTGAELSAARAALGLAAAQARSTDHPLRMRSHALR